MQRKPLTADFHEPGFVATLNGENTRGFWFQLSSDDRRQAGVPWGPANPQALNRYSYTLNSPVKYTDPSGHTPWCYDPGCGSEVVNHSDAPIEVQGNRYVQGCNPYIAGTDACYKRHSAVLATGESSADYGFTDVDRVRATDTNTINGHGHDDVLEVSDGMRVTITSAAPGKLIIEEIACGGWYGWRCEAGILLMPLLQEPFRWDQLPGWYLAKEKWWAEGTYSNSGFS